jgi:nitrite reductase/ring-hydroxylating ferredoxin subunit
MASICNDADRPKRGCANREGLVQRCLKFVDVIAFEVLPKGRGVSTWVAGHNVALFRVDDAVHAIEDSCPHAGSALGSGRLEGCVVRCPAHGLPFDVSTGCGKGNAMTVATYPVRVESGRVLVGVPVEQGQ